MSPVYVPWKVPSVNAILSLMHVPPFHRRIMPWVFVICFFAVAPALLFYTAGYRYNVKKGKIERNGTVIIDSQPRGATISLDGRTIIDQTPITLQDMAPGTHHFAITLDGYTSWEKTLDVRPEYVTFLNAIRLLKTAEPQILSTSTADLLSLAPNDEYLLLISMSPTSTYRILDAQGIQKMAGTLTPPPQGALRAIWQNDGSAVLLEPIQGGPAYLLDIGRTGQAIALPEAVYRFAKNELIGNDGKALISIRLSDLSLRRSPLNGILDTSDTAQVRTASGTRDAVLILTKNPEEGVVLPQGKWTIAAETTDRTLLRDGSRWLSIAAKKRPPDAFQASGDMLRPITISRTNSYILVHNSELWHWDLSKEPTLLKRQSDNIVEASWHYDGKIVFVATKTNVVAVDLDPRDGYLETTLAQFDVIKSLTASTKGLLYVAAVKNGASGVWTIETE